MPDALTDQQIAFAESYFKLDGPLFAYFSRKCYWLPQDIPDLVQEVWLRMYDRLDDIRDKNAIWPYIKRTAHSVYVDYVRRSSPPHGHALDAEQTADLSAPSPIDMIIRREGYLHLLGSLNNLPDAMREVAIADYELDRDAQAVALRLNRPVEYVYSMRQAIRGWAERNRSYLQAIYCPPYVPSPATMATVLAGIESRVKQGWALEYDMPLTWCIARERLLTGQYGFEPFCIGVSVLAHFSRLLGGEKAPESTGSGDGTAVGGE